MEVDGEGVEDEAAGEDDDADSIISGDGERRSQPKETADEDITTLDLTGLNDAQQARANVEIDLIERAQKWRKFFAEVSSLLPLCSEYADVFVLAGSAVHRCH